MITGTTKQLAAEILATDMETMVAYWLDRWPEHTGQEEEITEAMNKILKPFLARIEKLAAGTNIAAPYIGEVKDGRLTTAIDDGKSVMVRT